MYLIEIIAKFVKKVREKPYVNNDEEYDEGCDHMYLPIDSTKTYLACNRCGHVVKNPKRNIFIN